MNFLKKYSTFSLPWNSWFKNTDSAANSLLIFVFVIPPMWATSHLLCSGSLKALITFTCIWSHMSCWLVVGEAIFFVYDHNIWTIKSCFLYHLLKCRLHKYDMLSFNHTSLSLNEQLPAHETSEVTGALV